MTCFLEVRAGHRLALPATALTMVTLLGCADAHVVPLGEFEAPTCQDGRWDVAAALAPGLGADFVAVHAVIYDSGDGVLSQHGTRCLGVADAVACEQAIDDALAGDGPLLLLRRGTVVTVHYEESLVDELGPIDSVDEALLAAVVRGYLPPRCDESGDGGVLVEGGYQVVVTGDIACRPSGPGSQQRETLYRHRVDVRATGEVTELSRERDSTSYCEDSCSCREVGG
ncbi:MAG: hypothetical protein R3B40_29695 [Polyangiales bacterium]|nr:hypothetical protein [Sandaracinaceae bacterium]